MIRLIQTIGIIGFFVCIGIMYMTSHGIRGIREYDPAFQMPDMKFHYSVEEITQSFEQIGMGGRAIYQKYLLLDFVFILCFAIVMLTITDLVFTGMVRNLLFIVCILRGLFDVLENSFLLLVLKNYPTINKQLIVTSSYFTTCKFIMLYIWIFAMAIMIGLSIIFKVQGK